MDEDTTVEEREPPDSESQTEVHVFQSDNTWWVDCAEATLRFSDRTAALAAAKDLARQRSPSRVVSTAPPNWRVPALGVPSARRSDRVGGDGVVDWGVLAGPSALGRSLLVCAGTEEPSPWTGCPRVDVNEARLRDPSFLSEVRDNYLARTPVIYVVDRALEAPHAGVRREEVWGTPVDHDFVPEAAWTLLTRNSVDVRDGSPVWALADLAIALGARAGEGTDVLLPDGRAAWCDGGSLRLWTHDDLGTQDVTVVPREAIEVGSLEPTSKSLHAPNLAIDQLEAVSDPDVRARIVAPAGSGKTRVLTERARHLLGSSVPADALTLVAFNKRAQLEIVERTQDLPGLQVQTLNALALAILNGTRGFMSRGSRFDTINETAVRELLDSLVSFPRRANTDPAASWIDALSGVRLGLRAPRVVEEEFGGDVEGLPEVFLRYRAELARRGLVDFDEQIYLCLEVLLAEPEIRRHAQRRCQLLLVDEFQDLTPAHMLLLRLLAGPSLSIFGVGDDDQTIYGYSGATPRWLVNFDDYVPAARHHALTINYRCPVPVVTAASNLLSHNRIRVPKSIQAGPTSSSSPGSYGIQLHDDPTAATTERVQQLLDTGARPSEIAVLARVNSLLAPVQASLAEGGVPVQLRDGIGFLTRAGVAAALAWLRLAVAPAHLSRTDLTLAARRPSRGIAPRVIEWIGEQSDVAGIERLAGRISDVRSADKVAAFAADLERASKRATTATSASLLEFTSSEIGLERSMQTLDEAHIGRNSQAHSDDLRALIALGRVHPDPQSFPAWLARVLSTPSAPGGVTLATVHKVKGLEWPHVVVHDASSRLFPHRLSTDVEEERRVFHVAITRAATTLLVVADATSPSMFLDELSSMRSDEIEADPGTLARDRDDVEALEADVGASFQWGGYECTVRDVAPHHVTVTIGTATITIPLGSDVTLDGRPRRLAAPQRSPVRAAGTGAHDSPEIFDALKSWRLERARKDAVPAFVVASDRTLQDIARAMPANEVELLDVHGIGATKVELYGEEILAVLDAARPAS